MIPIALNANFSISSPASPIAGADASSQTTQPSAAFVVSSVQTGDIASDNNGTYSALTGYDRLVSLGLVRFLPSNATKPVPALPTAQFSTLLEQAPATKPAVPASPETTASATPEPSTTADSTSTAPATPSPLPTAAANAYAASAGRASTRPGQLISLV